MIKRRLTTEEGRKETRFIYTMLAIILVIVGMALYGWLTGRWEAEGQELPPLSKYEEQILTLEKEALDEAFKKHMVRLYEIWVTDYSPNIPPRAVKGARNARDAYERYMTAVEQREQRLHK